LRRASPARRHQ